MQCEEFGYNAACILGFVYRLKEQLSYEEACEMVRRTRAVVDPIRRYTIEEKMEELIGGPVPDDTFTLAHI